MYQICKFNPKKDIKATTPGQSIDVNESLATGTVLPAAKDTLYNALDDIQKVGSRVRDVFDALEASGQIASSIREASNSKESDT